MKLIVAGSRNIQYYETVKSAIDELVSQGMVINTIIDGTAKGVDELASRYAKENGIENLRVPAEWHLYRSGAGPVRNRKMAEMGDALLALWDGKSSGTKNMIKIANDMELQVKIVIVADDKEV